MPSSTFRWRQPQQCTPWPRFPCKKASSTQSASHPVPHGSTERALRRLTSEFGRDPVYSSRYGRWQQRILGERWLQTSHPARPLMNDIITTLQLLFNRCARHLTPCDCVNDSAHAPQQARDTIKAPSDTQMPKLPRIRQHIPTIL